EGLNVSRIHVEVRQLHLPDKRYASADRAARCSVWDCESDNISAREGRGRATTNIWYANSDRETLMSIRLAHMSSLVSVLCRTTSGIGGAMPRWLSIANPDSSNSRLSEPKVNRRV